MNSRFAKSFVHSVAIILILTALIKLIALVSHPKDLHGIDPLIGVRTHLLLVFIAALEGVIGLVLLTAQGMNRKLLMIVWLGSLLCVYRLGLWEIGYTKPCPCLGGPNSWVMSLQALHVDFIMKILLGYMLSVSSVLLLAESVMQRIATRKG